MLTPSQLSQRHLKAEGFTVANVEHWNPFAHIRQDLFGFADLLAFKVGEPVTLVQTTTKGHTSERLKKIEANETAHKWLEAGLRIEVHGWYKVGRKWEVKVTTL